MQKKKDFFISYASEDSEWAQWVGWVLEENGYSTLYYQRDFKEGENIFKQIDEALKNTCRTIALFSPAYFKSKICTDEWTAAFNAEPYNGEPVLLPIRVRPVSIDGLLKPLSYLDFTSLDDAAARNKLIDAVSSIKGVSHGKQPKWPGRTAVPEERNYPNQAVYPTPLVDRSRMPNTGSLLLGREKELNQLSHWWEDNETAVAVLIAMGGTGKTTLLNGWLNQMRRKNYMGAQRVFLWSFYSQGSEEGRQVAAGDFFQKTLEWMGDSQPREGTAIERARRLARMVTAQQVLLILDGLELLQCSPTHNGERHGMEGKLTDSAMQVFLKQVADSVGQGLCVITTRHRVRELENAVGYAVKELKLENLDINAGVQLLKELKVTKGLKGDFETAVEEYGGHALALTLLGKYLEAVYDGDVRKRDRIPRQASVFMGGSRAERVMAAYENWLGDGPLRELLYILGLFALPVPQGALEVLTAEPAIPGVTERLTGLSKQDTALAVHGLSKLGLLWKRDDVYSMDCHPLVREYFGARLQEQNPTGWQAAHLRLYDYYKNLPKNQYPDTLKDMEPLFAAAAHGCRAGRYNEVRYDIYWKRICREESYINSKLGAFEKDLLVLANFFDEVWSRPVAALSERKQALILSWAAFGLRAVGRLREAIQPMKAGLELLEKHNDWAQAAKAAGNLSELLLTLGEVSEAVSVARRAVFFANKSGDDFQMESKYTTLADALHLTGEDTLIMEAEKWFRQAEEKQKRSQPKFPCLYSLRGFRYCSFLLEKGAYQEVEERAQNAMEIVLRGSRNILDIALNNLSHARVLILQLEQKNKKRRKPRKGFKKAEKYLQRAVNELREYGSQQHLPRGLLACAAYYRLINNKKTAQQYLKEAEDIAYAGEMKLFYVDILLEKAKQSSDEIEKKKFFREARELMVATGYRLRLKEVNGC